MAPEIGPKSFESFEKQAPGPRELKKLVSVNRSRCFQAEVTTT